MQAALNVIADINPVVIPLVNPLMARLILLPHNPRAPFAISARLVGKSMSQFFRRETRSILQRSTANWTE